MAYNSNGASQYLVLDSLSGGSKYGLEIIEYISSKTGGNHIMKKPTLYSCLTRMEKKGLVSSSYWGESEMGGKRHYYSITTAGRRSLQELSQEFANVNFSQQEEDALQESTDDAIFLEKEESVSSQQQKPMFLHQDNLFNLMQEQPTQPSPSAKEAPKPNIVDNQIDIFAFEEEMLKTPQVDDVSSQPAIQPASDNQSGKQEDEDFLQTETHRILNEQKIEYYQAILQQSPAKEDALSAQDATNLNALNTQVSSMTETNINTNTTEEANTPAQNADMQASDDAKFLDATEKLTPDQEEQNKRLYDTSNDLKKYRKRKSFSENQIEMSVVYEKDEDQEIQRARIEELKASMLNARQNQYSSLSQNQNPIICAPSEEASQSNTNFSSAMPKPAEDSTLAEEVEDDAVFITSRIQSSEIPVQKRITPPNIEIEVTDGNLPAPKRNSNLEPTYKDMMAKLFEKKKEKPQQAAPAPEPQTMVDNYENIDTFADYSALKRYYQSHGIEFKEYNKSSVEKHHNTYFINFVSSVLMFLLSGIGCAVFYGILFGAKLLNTSTTFMFYAVPLLFFVFAIYTFIRDRVYVSKKAALKHNALTNWIVFVLSSVIVLVVNIIAGMRFESMATYATSLIIPIFALLVAFPLHYYIRKFAYKKYAK